MGRLVGRARQECRDRLLSNSSLLNNVTAEGTRGTHHDDARGSILQGLLDELRQDLRKVRRAPAKGPGVLRLRAQVCCREDEAQHVVDLLRGEETILLVDVLQRNAKLAKAQAPSIYFLQVHEPGPHTIYSATQYAGARLMTLPTTSSLVPGRPFTLTEWSLMSCCTVVRKYALCAP